MASGNVWEVRNLKFVILFLISWIITSSASVVRTTASSVFFFFFLVSLGFKSGFYMSEEAAAAAAIFRSDLMLGILNPRKNKLSLVFF